MSRTFRHVPEDVAYERITGHKRNETSFSMMTVEEMNDVMDYEEFSVKITKLPSPTLYYPLSSIRIARFGHNANEETVTTHTVTNTGFYYTEYDFDPTKPMPKKLMTTLVGYGKNYSEAFLPPVDDRGFIKMSQMQSSWEFVGGGFRKMEPVKLFSWLWPSFEEEIETYRVKIAAPIDDGVLSVRTDTRYRGHITGDQRRELLKSGVFLYDYDDDDCRPSRSRSKMEMLDVKKAVNAHDLSEVDDLDIYDEMVFSVR